MFDIQSLMSEAKKMMADVEERKAGIDRELSDLALTGSAGDGAVEISLSGSREVRGVKIKGEVVDPENVELLEDLVFAALQDALRQADAAYEEKMQSLSEGMEIGGIDVSSIKDLLG